MRIVSFDLETTNLSGLMGRILCCSFVEILPGGGYAKPYHFRADDKKFKQEDPINDSKLVIAIREELEKYNLLVGWNSKLFDQPFLNARLAKHRERALRVQMHLDLMYYAGGCTMRIGSKKLVNVQKFFSLGEAKTEISWEQWQRAGALNRKAMDEVVNHCDQDVKVLAEAYWRMIGHVCNLHR